MHKIFPTCVENSCGWREWRYSRRFASDLSHCILKL